MFLQRLAEYADQLEREGKLPPTMYQELDVRYVVQLDGSGTLQNLVTRSRKEGRRDVGVPMLVPYRKRAYAIKPKLLADHAEYTFQLLREKSEAARAAELHAAYVELVRKCTEETGEPSVKAVLNFLAPPNGAFDLSVLNLPADFDREAVITFEVEGVFPVDLPSVRKFWAKEASAADPNAPEMQCLVCGNVRLCAERLAIAIKGIPGDTMGMSLISANNDAFLSFGLRASLIAPTCEECGIRFSNALNALIRDHATHIRVGDSLYIFWSREDVGFSLATLLSHANPAEVREFLKAIWQANPHATTLDTTLYYAATLSGNNARVVVRDWIETTLTRAQQNAARYFELQRLRGFDAEDHWFSLGALANATVNPKSDTEKPAPQVGKALLHLALYGGELPMWLLYQAVRRLRAEQKEVPNRGGNESTHAQETRKMRTERVSPAHAALIKMVLQSQGVGQDMSKLDMTNRDPAYLCGRLLAVLESIQYAALGETNATIVDRYFGTASSAPASVFGRLLRGAQPHLATLRRDKPGAFVRLDEALREISTGLEAFPYTLKLEQQGLFALGYYHQRAADIAAARERNAAKVGAAASGADPNGTGA